MTSSLRELVEFLHHGNTQIRQSAIEHLVGYSSANRSIFKIDQLKPIRDLKLLVRDFPPIARCALEILVNTTHDPDIRSELSGDDAFIEVLLGRIISKTTQDVNLHCMLLANMAKSDSLGKLLDLRRKPAKEISSSPKAIDQLLDCFVKGTTGDTARLGQHDHLAYLFADLSKYDETRRYLVTAQQYDGVIPISKIKVFTNHPSVIRRRGVASTIKNASFPPTDPIQLLGPKGCEILSYLMLPIAAGSDSYTTEEMMELPDDLQLLDADKRREPDHEILAMHLETLLLLTSTKQGRDYLRDNGAYYVVRECHAAVEDEDIQERCDRVVQMLMRDEPAENGKRDPKSKQEREDESSEDDDKIVDIF